MSAEDEIGHVGARMDAVETDMTEIKRGVGQILDAAISITATGINTYGARAIAGACTNFDSGNVQNGVLPEATDLKVLEGSTIAANNATGGAS